MRIPSAVTLAAAMLALSSAADADAASVSVYTPPCSLEQSKYSMCFPDEARFVGDPGETNQLTVTAAPAGIRLHDAVSPVRAGNGCRSIDEHTADCSGSGIFASVQLGDGDDTAVTDGRGSVDAGDGDDSISGGGTLSGGAGDDVLVGGDSPDVLKGGAGADRLSGGKGDDTLQPDGSDAGTRDVVSGDDGTDRLSYEERAAPVTVSLVDLAAGEDDVTGVESVTGGKGADRLTGDAGPNEIAAGAGNDVITAGAGDDRVIAGDGDDMIIGGEGNDNLDAGDGADRIDGGEGNDVIDPFLRGGLRSDSVVCGTGADVVEVWDLPRVDRTCERLSLEQGSDYALKALVVHKPSARVPLVVLTGLREMDEIPPYRFRLRAVVGAGRGARVLGARSVAFRTDGALPATLGLRLSKRGLRFLAQKPRSVIRVTVSLRTAEVHPSLSFLLKPR